MFDNFSLRNKMLLGYCVPIVLFIVLGGITYSSITKKNALEEKIKLAQETTINVDESVYGLSRMVRNVRGRVLFPQDASYLKSYQEGLDAFQQASTQLKLQVKDPKQLERLNTIIADGNRLNQVAEQTFGLLSQGKIAQATQLTKTLRMSNIDKAKTAAIAQEQNFLKAASSQAQATNNLLVLLSTLGTLLTTLFALAVGIWLSANIGRTIKTVNQAASAIASSSTEIAATVEEQERTISGQASSVNQTTTTMDELGASSRQSAEQAEASASGASQALTLAEDGTKAVQQTLKGMSTLKEQVNEIANAIIRLSEQTGQIGSVSSLVGDLANQTNMLALNAAVEAARAGEHGKGFGVVATEIRKLADQSKKSSEKINTLVGDIQSAINKTVMVTDEGTKKVDRSLELTQGTAKIFTGVADSVNHVFLNSQQISLSAKQQAIAVQQVVTAMNSINLGAKESATGITQVKSSAQQLKVAAQKLQAVV
ncbi:methyl-accepting chemotaxis protein [Synechocystis sp. PCC 7509]|uniref:methyl-accepting chemotaxis protein n=1 Tax=Synechocystis sp. PCC 7509 TaxID=927677 RepID=UPI0002AC7D2B|nr:methyl-accepting chemotaxis protein [Synechocystis sp. PCC 7509]